MSDKEKNPLVGIAGAIGVFTFLMVLFIVLFAEQYTWVSIFIVGFMALLGILLGHYSVKKESKKNK